MEEELCIDDFKFHGEEKCTPGQWENLFNHPAWKEYLDTVKMRLSITRSELETCTVEQAPMLQGEAKQCRFTMNFQTLIMSEIEQNRKEQDNGRDDRAE